MHTRFNCRKELAMSRFNQSLHTTAIAALAEPAVAAPAARVLDARPHGAAELTTRSAVPSAARAARIVILGGGFGGVAAARRLGQLFAGRSDVEITVVSRDNFFVITPLLFEACSGRLELRHCAQPIRTALRRARFIEATVTHVDVDRKIVQAVGPSDGPYELPYDQLVVALGAATNEALIPGSEAALTFKTTADALVLRNHLIERLERADAAITPAARRRCLTFAVVGGGLVGIELLGELTAFAGDVLRYYPSIRREELRFHLFQSGPRILPEIDAKLADIALRVLRARGADIRVSTPVRAIERERIHLADETIEAATIVLASGILPSAVAAAMPVEHDQRGRIVADATMRSKSHPTVWALGDCAAIPGPDGKPYPALAQHAIREARRLAENIAAVVDGGAPAPFVFRSLGTMASLGHTQAVARVFGVRLTGFPAWFARRTYYLFQMPHWDRRLRIVLDWTVSLFSRPDVTKIDIATEQAQIRGGSTAGPPGPERL
jgi:NADH dehydrogenase